jgi:hypothetical protein
LPERRLDDVVRGQQRLDHRQHLWRIPFRPAFDAAEHPSLPINQKACRQTVDLEGLADRIFGIEIGPHLFEPEFGDERLDRLAAAHILRYREDRDLVAESCLQPLQGRHFFTARRAPGGPEIDKNQLAGEIIQPDRFARGVGKADLRRRPRPRGRDELPKRSLVGGGLGPSNRRTARQNQQRGQQDGAARSHDVFLSLQSGRT